MSLQPTEATEAAVKDDPDITHLYCGECGSWSEGRQYAGCGKDITDLPEVEPGDGELCIVCQWWEETYEPCKLCGAS